MHIRNPCTDRSGIKAIFFFAIRRDGAECIRKRSQRKDFGNENHVLEVQPQGESAVFGKIFNEKDEV